jgi:hypothetical protein
MFINEDSRWTAFLAMSLLAVLLAVVGQWAFTGLLGGALLCCAVGVNFITTCGAPQVPSRFYGPVTLVLGIICFVTALVVGLVVLGWWGIAFAVGAVVVYMLAAAARG